MIIYPIQSIESANGKLGTVSLPSNPHGGIGSMHVKANKQDPLTTSHQRLFPLAMVALLAAFFGLNPKAHAQDVPTASGVPGKVQSVGTHSTQKGKSMEAIGLLVTLEARPGNALRFHWLCAYLLMLNGLVYLVGLCLGGGWRSLLPRLSDARGGLQMARYYLSLPYTILARRQPIHPNFRTKYNPLQRLAYFTVAVAGFLAVATGWAIHKPAQLSWLTAIFGGFDQARVWHFWLMVFFLVFVIPHVVLVIADGWDTLRSMITGWSTKFKRSEVSDHEL